MGRPEGDLRRKQIGELATAVLFYISFSGKATEDFGENVGERREYPTRGCTILTYSRHRLFQEMYRICPMNIHGKLKCPRTEKIPATYIAWLGRTRKSWEVGKEGGCSGKTSVSPYLAKGYRGKPRFPRI